MASIAISQEHKQNVLDIYFEWEVSQYPEGALATVVLPSEGPPIQEDGRATLHGVPEEFLALLRKQNIPFEVI